MKRTITSFILLMSLGTGSLISAQPFDEEKDLQEIYQQIDDAIDNSAEYVAVRLRQITETQGKLLTESKLEKRFELAEQLFELYKPYKNDSTLYYADMCIALADSLGRKDMVGLYLSEKALQCSYTGMYVEALELLKKVDRQALGREELTKYYRAWMHVCGEIGSYDEQPEVRQKYYNLQDSYRDSVLAVAADGSEEFLHLRMDVLSARRQYQDALSFSNRWIGSVADGTHEKAYAAFYCAMVYEKLGNGRMLRYWLGKSALDDIKCAVFNQASLFMLAERLCDDGDYERAERYIRFSVACNTAFSPQLRNYQVRYLAHVMEALYKNSQTRYSKLLTIAGVGTIILLGIIVCIAWLYLRQRRITRSRNKK